MRIHVHVCVYVCVGVYECVCVNGWENCIKKSLMALLVSKLLYKCLLSVWASVSLLLLYGLFNVYGDVEGIQIKIISN